MTIAVCLNKQNYTSECLDDSGSFSVSVLEDDVPMTFIGQFGFKTGREIDKFANVDYVTGELDVPIVKDWSLSGFEAKIIDRIDVLGGKAVERVRYCQCQRRSGNDILSHEKNR